MISPLIYIYIKEFEKWLLLQKSLYLCISVSLQNLYKKHKWKKRKKSSQDLKWETEKYIHGELSLWKKVYFMPLRFLCFYLNEKSACICSFLKGSKIFTDIVCTIVTFYLLRILHFRIAHPLYMIDWWVLFKNCFKVSFWLRKFNFIIFLTYF